MTHKGSIDRPRSAQVCLSDWGSPRLALNFLYSIFLSIESISAPLSARVHHAAVENARV